VKKLRKEGLLMFLPERFLPPKILSIIFVSSTSVLCDVIGLLGKRTDGRVPNSVEVAAQGGGIRH
jgi:hypothetical protein